MPRRGWWRAAAAAAAATAWAAAVRADEDPDAPCVPGTDPCCFEDADGDPWDLSFAAGLQETRGPSTTGDWSYAFSICNNVDPVGTHGCKGACHASGDEPRKPFAVSRSRALRCNGPVPPSRLSVPGSHAQCIVHPQVPAACEAASVFATAALRHESTICEQLGPDINLAPTAVAVTKAGSGVLMLWSFGPRSFSLEIECGESGIPGLATEGDAPYVLWRQNGICDAGPGEPIIPVEEIQSYWGRTFLILLGVAIFL